MKHFFSLFLILITCILIGQEDVYHTNLKDMLHIKYGLAGGFWVFSPNEITNASNTTGSGGARTLVDIGDHSFSKATQLSITIVPANGWNAGLSLNTSQSIETAFGTAINESKIAGNKNQDNAYQEKLFNLDGKGHGFSEVVFENGLKWPYWERGTILTKDQEAATVMWLSSHGMKVRGHNIVWPGWSNSPADLKSNAGNVSYLINRICTHIYEMLNYIR